MSTKKIFGKDKKKARKMTSKECHNHIRTINKYLPEMKERSKEIL